MKSWIKVLFTVLFISLFSFGCGGGGGGGGDDGQTPVGEGTPPIFTQAYTLASVEEIETFTEADGSTVKAAKDEVFLLVRNDISETELENISKKIVELGGTIIGSDMDLMVAQIRTTNELSIINAIKTMPGVILASLNAVCQSDDLTNDEGAKLAFLEQGWGHMGVMAAMGIEALTDTVSFPDDGGWWMGSINIQKAWETSTGSKDVTIGIVDTGIKADQKILDSSRISRFSADGKAITDDDSAVAEKGYHGLWVTGFAAGFVDAPSTYSDAVSGINVRGVNPTSKVIMTDVYRSDKDGTKTILVETSILNGIKTAITKGSKIVNISSAADTETCPDEVCKVRRQKEFRSKMIGALEVARDKKALLVFAAGNDNIKIDNDLFYDGMASTDMYTAMWNAYTMVVGASTNSPKLTDAYFSRMGSIVDLIAPGDNIGFSQGGVDMIKSDHRGSGTSYAAPLVTGVGSLLMSVIDPLLPTEAKYLLTSSAAETVDTKYSPKKQLDADAAIRSAKLLEGVSMSELETVKFTKKDEKKSVDLPVTIPTSGVYGMDIVFLIDVTGSYNDDIATMKSQANAILTDLTSRGINVQFGVASFTDFPISPYGASTDVLFTMLQTLTSDTDKIKTAINSLSIQNGGDEPEAQYEALFHTTSSAGWREGALHVVVLCTDANFHDSLTETAYPGKSSTDTLAALATKSIMVVGMSSGNAKNDLIKIVDNTDGQLFELSTSSAGIAIALSDMMEAATISFNVAYQILAGDEFKESITPAEGFVEVPKGGSVTFKANLINQKSPSIFKDQMYDIVIWIKANGSIIKRIRIPIEIDAKIPGI
jgi:hypothetical protein